MSVAVQKPDSGLAVIDRTTVRDVMRPGIISCSRSADASLIARAMTEARVHCVAVVGHSQDESRRLMIWGIVSDLDVLAAIDEGGTDLTAADLAKQPVISVRPDLSLRAAARAMVQYGVHHVVVAAPEEHLPVGILSTLDIAEVVATALRR